MTMTDLTRDIVVQVPLSEITIDRKWNVRKYLGDDAENGPEEHSFGDLVQNITQCGQDTPVRLKKGDCDDLNPYFLIEGFRRSAAIQKIYDQKKEIPGLQAGCIKAVIETTMTELEALIRNGRENTARQNLNMADTAFLVHRLAKHGLNDSQIAGHLALSQSYVNQLHTVFKGTSVLTVTLKDGRTLNVFDHWREAPGRVTFQTLLELARVKVNPRIKELKYLALLSVDKEVSAEEKKAIGKKNDFSLAETFGCMIGRLEAKGLVNISGNWLQLLEVGKRIKLNDQSTDYKERVVSSAKEGYQRGLNQK